MSQLERFAKWHMRSPARARELIDLVLQEIEPVFVERGFERSPEYAGGNVRMVGANCLPYQQREGVTWPTVEITFVPGRPQLGVDFAVLPETCWRVTSEGFQEIDRSVAKVTEGPAFFALCKGERKNFDCNFGYGTLALRPSHRLSKEVAQLKSILPWLFEVLEKRTLEGWYREKPGFVAKHAFLSRASIIFLKPDFPKSAI